VIQDVLDYWPFLGGAVAFVAGYSRLESKARSNEEDIKNLGSRMNEQRKEDLARTESMLGEIRGDVKQLLQRGS
jgi:hypothetical protein